MNYPLTNAVPVGGSLNRFKSSRFNNVDEIFEYMKKNKCVQYDFLLQFGKTKIPTAFLMWMFQSDSIITTHKQLDVEDIKMAYNVFWRYFSGEYDSLGKHSTLVVILEVLFYYICFKISQTYYGLSDVIFVVSLFVIPIEMAIMVYLKCVSIKEMKFTTADFIIQEKLKQSNGQPLTERLTVGYLSVRSAKTLLRFLR